jgi:hypothetical protein
VVGYPGPAGWQAEAPICANLMMNES